MLKRWKNQWFFHHKVWFRGRYRPGHHPMTHHVDQHVSLDNTCTSFCVRNVLKKHCAPYNVPGGYAGGAGIDLLGQLCSAFQFNFSILWRRWLPVRDEPVAAFTTIIHHSLSRPACFCKSTNSLSSKPEKEQKLFLTFFLVKDMVLVLVIYRVQKQFHF